MSAAAVATRGPVRVVGTGLLGASVGLALATRGVDVTLDDPSRTALALARDVGAGRPAEVGDRGPTVVPGVRVPGALRPAAVVDGAVVHDAVGPGKPAVPPRFAQDGEDADEDDDEGRRRDLGCDRAHRAMLARAEAGVTGH